MSKNENFKNTKNSRKGSLRFDPNEEKSRSRAQQHFRDEVDVNNIIARYNKTGLLPLRRSTIGEFRDDLVNSLTYQEALDVVSKSEEKFAELPANIRSRFKNDPAQFLQFISDDNNAQEAYKLGLLSEKPATAPVGGAASNNEPQSGSQKEEVAKAASSVTGGE
jgi:phage internal scaffolding protein